MSAAPHPSQVLSSQLAGTPEQVWARVCHSGFIASYLGARLAPVDLAAAALGTPALQGTAQDGQAVSLSVTARQAPSSLSLCLHTAGQTTALHLSISACAAGSRLTVLHQPVLDQPVLDRPVPDQPALAALAPAAACAGAPCAALALRLASPLPAMLQGGAPDHPAALQAAAAYLAETADLVGQMRQAMAPRQGYAQPAQGGFSLVQHLWHLADVEQLGWSQRFVRLRTEPQAVLPDVDGDRLAIDGRYQQRPWRAAALRFMRCRQHSLGALALCDLAVLRRPVRFSGQPSTGAEVLAAMLAHDQGHRAEMAALWPPANR